MEERLQRTLARAGFGSRRACEEFILAGRVKVNGQIAQLGQKADPARDKITLDGEPLPRPEKLTYVALYKPRGVVSSLAPQGARRTVSDLVPLGERLYPVGRLDVDSEGLILLTNDGALTDRLTHPRYEIEKEYRVLVSGESDEDRLDAWRRGVVLPADGRRTAAARVTREGREHGGTWLRVVMHEGRKHEIRDIGRALHLPVQRLIRVRMATLKIGELKPGQWRELDEADVARLRGKPVEQTGKNPARRRKRER